MIRLDTVQILLLPVQKIGTDWKVNAFIAGVQETYP